MPLLKEMTRTLFAVFVVMDVNGVQLIVMGKYIWKTIYQLLIGLINVMLHQNQLGDAPLARSSGLKAASLFNQQ